MIFSTFFSLISPPTLVSQRRACFITWMEIKWKLKCLQITFRLLDLLVSSAYRQNYCRSVNRSDHQRLSDIFVQKGPYLKMYSTYIRQFDNNVALLDEQCRKNPAFASVVREFEVIISCVFSFIIRRLQQHKFTSNSKRTISVLGENILLKICCTLK